MLDYYKGEGGGGGKERFEMVEGDNARHFRGNLECQR